MTADGLLARLGTVIGGGVRRAGADPGLRAMLYGNPLYPLTLFGPVPRRLAVRPSDPWPGDPGRGDALFEGRWTFAGCEVTAPKRPIWFPTGVSAAWLEEAHAFEWLRDFKASGGETARRFARGVVRDWMSQCGHWRPVAWRADVLGRRVAAWSIHAAFLENGADEEWIRRFLASLALQVRHLARVATRETAGGARIQALRGLLYGAVALGRGRRRIDAALRLIERECRRQVLADGGHIERSPALHRRVLGDLADCRALLLAANLTPPEFLTRVIDRMTPMLALWCHGDGGLATFNDSGEGDPALVAATFKLAGVRARALGNAPHTGFQRLVAGRTVAILDAGAPAPRSRHAHAGTLAFELSVGEHRLVTNCGPHGWHDAAWSRALRGTAAHSTLVVSDTNSSDIAGDGTLAGRARVMSCERNEADGATWVDADHDGYVGAFGFVHRRRLYLGADGSDLRGEDSLLPAEGALPGPQPFAIRFHLHPAVQASLVANGHAALFRLADGSGWQLRAVGGSLAINAGIHFGRDGARRRSEQAVIAGVAGPEGMTVKWAIRRIKT